MNKLKIFVLLTILFMAICLLFAGTAWKQRGSVYIDAQLEAARWNAGAGNFDDALRAYNHAIIADEACAEAYIGLTSLYLESGNSRAAAATARSGYELTRDTTLAALCDELAHIRIGIEQPTLPSSELEHMLCEWFGHPDTPLRESELTEIESFELVGNRLRINGLAAKHTDKIGTSAEIFPDRIDLAEFALGFKKLPNLTSLTLSDCGITDPTPLGALTSLIRLDLSDNAIRSMEPLGRLSSLKTLVINKNPIADVTPPDGMTSLVRLVIDPPPKDTVTPDALIFANESTD